MDEVNKIRKLYFIKGKSINYIAKKLDKSWETVDLILKIKPEDLPKRGLRPNRKSKVINDQVVKRINELFDDERIKKVHKKQRYTRHHIFNLLKKENLYTGTERYLRTVINGIRNTRSLSPQIKNTFLDLEFPFGKYLQIDHGEAEIVVSGIRTIAYLFVATVPGVPIRYSQIFLTKASEAWGEFHERTFVYFDGVFENCMYDNDSVLKSTGSGTDTAFFTELQIHYGFEGINCNKASGWEKGSVENAVGYCRRNFLAGLPEANTIEDLNAILHEKCVEDLTQVCENKLLSEWKSELKVLLDPLKPSKSWQIYSELKVSHLQTITYNYFNYSVPERYVGTIVRVYSSVSKIRIFDESDLIHEHVRSYFGKDNGLELDHYLDQLLRKPKAILFAKVVNKSKFSESLNALRMRMQAKYPYPAGDLEFIKTICLSKKYDSQNFTDAIEIALSYGSLTSQAVECIIKQLLIKSVEVIPIGLLPSVCNEAPDFRFDLMKYQSLVQSEVSHVE
jgi:transposase